MNEIYVERRKVTESISLSWDLAHHLYTRRLDGIVLIVANRPAVLLPAVRKQWVKVIARVEREHASTLNSTRRQILGDKISEMEGLKFVVGIPKPESVPGVFFITPLEFTCMGAVSHTVYLTYDIQNDVLYKNVLRHGLMVLYKTP
jgi:hypothetical protein